MTKEKVSAVFIVAIAAGTILYAQGVTINLPGMNRGYSPKQPIEFSHRVHSGDLGMSCQYCHTGVDKSRHAGIPSASTCMNCHRFVTASRRQVEASRHSSQRVFCGPVSGELQKLYDAVGFDPRMLESPRERAGVPLEWIRVHSLPDFVRFDHRPHVISGVSCEHCHGPVSRMERMSQWSDLSMGWCVNCHRDVNSGRIEALRGRQASTDCSVCHY